MRIRSAKRPAIWNRLLLASSLLLLSAGAAHAMGGSLLDPGAQDSFGFRLRAAAAVVFRSLRPFARRLDVDLDLAAVGETLSGPPEFLEQAYGVTGHLAPCEHSNGSCLPTAP